MIPRPEPLERLLSLLRAFPTVGPKLSERIAFYLLKLPDEKIKELVQTIEQAHQEVRPCASCGYWDDRSPCRICSDPSRDSSLLCVVEKSQDLFAFSRIKKFHGLFFVLDGVLSPLDGIGPQDLRIAALMKRIAEGNIREVILALNPDMEGDATAEYVAKEIQAHAKKMQCFPIRITRLAQGLPVGSEIEYADELTLSHSFEQRKNLTIADSNSADLSSKSCVNGE